MKLHKILLLSALLATAGPSVQAEELVILHTNDTHSQIDPMYNGRGGVLRRKALVDSVRQADKNVIVVDAGDIVQGTLFFNIYKGEVEEKVMNHIGYDYRILGNHEFDNGMQALADNLRQADATLLAANYQMRGTPLDGLFQPYGMREIDGKRIAFLPVNLQPEGMISKSNYEGMGYVDAVEAANKMAWYLKNILQADVVIALTHIGYDTAGQENDRGLIASSKDIDLVIGGHTHTYVDPDDPNSVPHTYANADGRQIVVAQVGKGGQYVGKITIDLDDPTKVTSHLLPVDDRYDDRVDDAFVALIEPYRAKVDSLNHNSIGRAAKDLDKDQPALLNFGSDFVAYRGRQLADGIDFGILNKGGLRNSLTKGDITEGQLITMMPFFNRIMVIDISGRDLLDAFNVMAVVGGNGVSEEVEAVFDPATNECLDIKIAGKDLDLDKMYRVATIDYLANGGDYMVSLKNHKPVAISDQYMYEDLIDYFRSGPMKGKKLNPSDKVRMRPVK